MPAYRISYPITPNNTRFCKVIHRANQCHEEKIAVGVRPVKTFDDSLRTADLSFPFNALGQFSRGENWMVGPLGLD
jgi:hypothetical protein